MQYFKQGYNCAQSVVLAHCDIMEMDREQALKISQSFGGGMGRMRHVCGAVSGMFMVAGMLTGSAEPDDVNSKKENYDMVQRLAAAFEQKHGTIICRQLLGLEEKHSLVSPEYQTGSVPEPRTEAYYKKRPCVELVGDACDILAEVL